MKRSDPEYWKEWYWHRGGREKVQYSRKVTQPLHRILAQQKYKEDDRKTTD